MPKGKKKPKRKRIKPLAQQELLETELILNNQNAFETEDLQPPSPELPSTSSATKCNPQPISTSVPGSTSVTESEKKKIALEVVRSPETAEDSLRKLLPNIAENEVRVTKVFQVEVTESDTSSEIKIIETPVKQSPGPSTSASNELPEIIELHDGTICYRGTGKYEGIAIPYFALPDRGYTTVKDTEGDESPDRNSRHRGKQKTLKQPSPKTTQMKGGKKSKDPTKFTIVQGKVQNWKILHDIKQVFQQTNLLSPEEHWERFYCDRMRAYFPTIESEETLTTWRNTRRLVRLQNPNVNYVDWAIFFKEKTS